MCHEQYPDPTPAKRRGRKPGFKPSAETLARVRAAHRARRDATRQRSHRVVSTRLTITDQLRLDTRLALTGQPASDFVRVAILNALEKE